ncbi:hexosaminidase [Povalibacter uvarum]|uniref:beta-N-acetylhexosaminidase n=1 Tax=Povalibacter uvarum TaxID=732238 RepID=A0A841HTL4_9GAMM|nr:family 20 glycosylhydrolase [Povalibacter uvarum]MBB6095348.1 hexosaminidase [Povalibacter uvarum]
MKVGAQTLMVWLLLSAGMVHAATDRSLEPPIVPAPAVIEMTGGTFTVDKETQIVIANDPRALAIAHYFGEQLFRIREFRPAIVQVENPAAVRKVIRFTLQQTQSSPDPESYELEISSQGVQVAARDMRGLFYGATTLWQILAADTAAADEIRLPALRISDTPRLRWRGLMLDSANRFQSVAFIKRFIDTMALHKLNVLHWHLADDGAWRIESRKYPKLATNQGGAYSQREISEIVAYAAERNVTIVPGISLPAHAGAMIAAYPHLGAARPAADETRLLNVQETTFAFIGDVLGEIAQLFPSDYIHVGSGQYPLQQWESSADVQARMRELGVVNAQQLQAYFMQRVTALGREQRRRIIGWDQYSNTGTPQQTIAMTSRGLDGALGLSASGYDVVTSADALDFSRPQTSVLANEPPGNGSVMRIEDVYAFDPAPSALGAEDLGHLMGVEATIWTHRARSEADVELLAFPRAAALAEIAWTPSSRQRWSSFAGALPVPLKRYAKLGVQYSDAAYRVAVTLHPTADSPQRVRVELSRQVPAGEIRYTTNGTEPTARSPVYKDVLNVSAPTTVKAASFLNNEPLSSAVTFDVTSGTIQSARATN